MSDVHYKSIPRLGPLWRRTRTDQQSTESIPRETSQFERGEGHARRGGKSVLVIFRLYGPLETWFDKTWKPGEFALLK
jgi:hypothetical protein